MIVREKHCVTGAANAGNGHVRAGPGGRLPVMGGHFSSLRVTASSRPHRRRIGYRDVHGGQAFTRIWIGATGGIFR